MQFHFSSYMLLRLISGAQRVRHTMIEEVDRQTINRCQPGGAVQASWNDRSIIRFLSKNNERWLYPENTSNKQSLSIQ